MGRLLIALGGALALILQTAGTTATAQDVAQGRTVFQANCAVCHMALSNGHAMIGPNLWGIVGRRAASVAGFAYSPAMQHANITWTSDQLSAFVQAPAAHSARHAHAIRGVTQSPTSSRARRLPWLAARVERALTDDFGCPAAS